MTAKYLIYERLPYNKVKKVCETNDLETAKQYLKGFKDDPRQFAVVTRTYLNRFGLKGVKGLPGPGPGQRIKANPNSTRSIFQKRNPE